MSTDDKQLYQYGKWLARKADKLLAEGKISRYQYWDLYRKAFDMTRPRDHVKIVGL